MGGIEENACRVVRWVANQIRDGVVRWMQRHASVVCWPALDLGTEGSAEDRKNSNDFSKFAIARIHAFTQKSRNLQPFPPLSAFT